MKRYTYFFMVILSMTFLSSIAAAQSYLGVEGGFQLNSVRATGVGALLNGIPKSIITPYARLQVTNPVGDKGGIRIGAGYSQKGFQLAKGLNVNILNVPIGIGAKVSTVVDYVEIPVEGIYQIKKRDKNFFITAGANIGYAVGAKVQPKASIIIDINLPKIPIDLNDNNYNRFDVSGTIGFGMIKEGDSGNLILQARYVQSFSNLLNNAIAGVRLKPYSYQFGIGYQYFINQNTI